MVIGMKKTKLGIVQFWGEISKSNPILAVVAGIAVGKACLIVVAALQNVAPVARWMQSTALGAFPGFGHPFLASLHALDVLAEDTYQPECT